MASPDAWSAPTERARPGRRRQAPKPVSPLWQAAKPQAMAAPMFPEATRLPGQPNSRALTSLLVFKRTLIRSEAARKPSAGRLRDRSPRLVAQRAGSASRKWRAPISPAPGRCFAERGKGAPRGAPHAAFKIRCTLAREMPRRWAISVFLTPSASSALTSLVLARAVGWRPL